MIEYLYKVIRLLVRVLSKMKGYVLRHNVKDGDKDKNNQLMCSRIDHEKLLEKNKTIWT